MKTFHVKDALLDLRCELAEGPYWEKDANVLRFVDIVKKDVHRYSIDESSPTTQRLRSQHRDISIGVTAELSGHNDSFLFGGKHGIGIAKKESTDYKYIARFWSQEERAAGKENRMRTNDGSVDSRGRFWINTMVDPESGDEPDDSGVLFRLDNDGTLHRILEGVTIPNGMSWSFDDKTFYFTDSPTQNVYAYDFDAESGSISNRRIFYHSPDGSVPDGHAQDEHGNLWIALHGVWKVVQVSPDGEVLAEVQIPTRCPTACTFAGETLYITSEAESEGEKYPESLKFAGSVFGCDVGVKGRPAFIAKFDV